MPRGSLRLWRFGTWSLGAALLTFWLLPLVTLVTSSGMAEFSAATTHGLRDALAFSVRTTVVSLAIVTVTGLPLAWRIARSRGAGRWLEEVVQVGRATPPAVAGIALLATFGEGGPLSGSVTDPAMLVVLAQTWVAAPHFVTALTTQLRALDDDMLWAARSLGASPAKVFFRVAIPAIGPAFVEALGMAWARAIGELGATLLVAASLLGDRSVLPVAILRVLDTDPGAARALALTLFAFAILVFALARSLVRARDATEMSR